MVLLATGQRHSRLSRRLDHWQDYRGGVLPVSKDALRRGLKVWIRGLEDVGNELLRIAVDHWEPRALNLDHDAMTFPKHVVVREQIDVVFDRLVWADRFGLFETIAESPTQHVGRDH